MSSLSPEEGTRSPPCGFWKFQKFHLFSSDCFHCSACMPALSERVGTTHPASLCVYACHILDSQSARNWIRPLPVFSTVWSSRGASGSVTSVRVKVKLVADSTPSRYFMPWRVSSASPVIQFTKVGFPRGSPMVVSVASRQRRCSIPQCWTGYHPRLLL